MKFIGILSTIFAVILVALGLSHLLINNSQIKLRQELDTQQVKLGEIQNNIQKQQGVLQTQQQQINNSAQLSKEINDIIALAKEDDDAKEIVKKWNIQSN